MIEKIVSNEKPYKTVNRGSGPPENFDKTEYWERVELTLERVFMSDRAAAKTLRNKVDGSESDTQTAFYHADPFEVAADLAGHRQKPITAEQKRLYIALIKSRNTDPSKILQFPKDEELRPTHPEEEP